jgi:hypothetical protein
VCVEHKEGYRREDEDNSPACKASVKGLHIEINFRALNVIILIRIEIKDVVKVGHKTERVYKY